MSQTPLAMVRKTLASDPPRQPAQISLANSDVTLQEHFLAGPSLRTKKTLTARSSMIVFNRRQCSEALQGRKYDARCDLRNRQPSKAFLPAPRSR
jgi:hypothetical protein